MTPTSSPVLHSHWFVYAVRNLRVPSLSVTKMNQIKNTGRVAISSGSYFSLHEYVAGGPVYITIETRGKSNGNCDGETLHSNVQVAKDQSILVDQGGYLLNVKHGTIWTDISGKCHNLQETTDWEITAAIKEYENSANWWKFVECIYNMFYKYWNMFGTYVALINWA